LLDPSSIELLTINDHPYFGQISEDELIYIWVVVLNRSKEELIGVIGTKSLTRLVRGTFRLKAPIKIRDVFQTEEFKYEKVDESGTETITARVLGFHRVKPVELGQKAVVQVKTNFGVEAEGVTNWLKLYGNVITQTFVKSNLTGLSTDVVEAEIILKEHIPEYLPMYGQKCQVSYPGIPKLCNKCYKFNHFRKECNNKSKDWIEFVIEYISQNRISHELIGTWKGAIQRWENANADEKPIDENADDSL